MVTSIAALASTLKQNQVGIEVGVGLLKTVKNAAEDQGNALVKLIDSTQTAELMVNPDLGSNIDLRG